VRPADEFLNVRYESSGKMPVKLLRSKLGGKKKEKVYFVVLYVPLVWYHRMKKRKKLKIGL